VETDGEERGCRDEHLEPEDIMVAAMEPGWPCSWENLTSGWLVARRDVIQC